MSWWPVVVVAVLVVGALVWSIWMEQRDMRTRDDDELS